MLVSEFDYDLPEELIAQTPSEKRENSRMMVLNREEHKFYHKHFYDIVDYLDDNCILVKGSVPGPKKGMVIIKSAVKTDEVNEAFDLITYEEEEVVEPTLEASAENTVEEVKEA